MVRPVLGNDPFLRGAAPTGVPPPQPEAVPVVKRPASSPRKTAARPVRPPIAVPSQPASVAEEESSISGWAQRIAPLRRLPGQLAQALGDGSRLLPFTSALEGAWAALQTGLGLASTSQLDAYGQDAELLSRLRPWRDFFYRRYFRVTVEGAASIPRGGVLLVGNHAGAIPLDGWAVTEAVRRERPDLEEPRWLVEDQVFCAPFFGTLYNRLGALRASPENAERLLRDNRPLAVFPEGIQGIGKPFVQRYRLQRFGRGGFVKLALRLGVPLVPVAIVGAEETLPLLARIPVKVGGFPFIPVSPAGLLPLPAKWTVAFGPPLDLEGLSASAADDLGIVQRLTERTRATIQGMLERLLAARTSVFT